MRTTSVPRSRDSKPKAEADAFVTRHRARLADSARLNSVDSALCAYAEKLTSKPTEMTEADVQSLRKAGLDDIAIHDATQVIGYFNYINRVADALGVESEDFIRSWGASPDWTVAPTDRRPQVQLPGKCRAELVC